VPRAIGKKSARRCDLMAPSVSRRQTTFCRYGGRGSRTATPLQRIPERPRCAGSRTELSKAGASLAYRLWRPIRFHGAIPAAERVVGRSEVQLDWPPPLSPCMCKPTMVRNGVTTGPLGQHRMRVAAAAEPPYEELSRATPEGEPVVVG